MRYSLAAVLAVPVANLLRPFFRIHCKEVCDQVVVTVQLRDLGCARLRNDLVDASSFLRPGPAKGRYYPAELVGQSGRDADVRLAESTLAAGSSAGLWTPSSESTGIANLGESAY